MARRGLKKLGQTGFITRVNGFSYTIRHAALVTQQFRLRLTLFLELESERRLPGRKVAIFSHKFGNPIKRGKIRMINTTKGKKSSVKRLQQSTAFRGGQREVIQRRRSILPASFKIA
ncbi:hypothetical protein TcWFU_002207 [Taenia crassiceps]|uniref:Uncharacterized protein n=1 Tax=Taenia crassiceps TaxID=6207 RepID=A0ABR4QPF7_9CEST